MRVDVGRDRLDTCRRAAANDRDRSRRRDRELVREARHHACIFSIRASAALLCEFHGRSIGAAADVTEEAVVPDLGHCRFHRHALLLQEGVEAHQAQTNAALAHRGIDGAFHFRRRALDEVFQHIVEEAEHVLHELRLFFPFHERFGVQGGEAAHGGAFTAIMIHAGVQHDFRAQVRLANLEAELLLVARHRLVHGVGEDDVGLAGLQAELENLLPDLARIDVLQRLLVFR